MLMVVLGAGASYDSAVEIVAPLASNGHRPPLANQLFENREVFLPVRNRFPQINPIIGYIPTGGGKAVEQVLQQLQSEAARYPERYKQLTAVRFYLQDLLTTVVESWYGAAGLGPLGSCHGATNQLTLIDQLRLAQLPEPVCLVTFNYDTLIERALSHYGQRIDALDDYICHDLFKLFKLHGSVNWARRLANPPGELNLTDAWAVARSLMDNAANLHPTNEFVFTRGGNAPPLSVLQGRPVLPAIAIPVETKIDFECPAEHIAMLRELIPRTTAILTIGWRGTEQHFLDLLGELVTTPVHLAACADSAPNANSTLAQLRAHLRPATTQIFQHGFRHMVANECEQLAAFIREGCPRREPG